MPCTDFGAEEEFRNNQLNEATAIACAALTVLEENKLMGHINWEESGLSKIGLRRWWDNHKKQDVERRKAEAAAKLTKKLKASLHKNFTPEELAELKRIVPGFPGI